jgi:hypothetical protein
MSNIKNKMQEQLTALRALEDKLECCEEENPSDDMILIRMGCSTLQLILCEFDSIIFRGIMLSVQEKIVLSETVQESIAFLSLHENAIIAS